MLLFLFITFIFELVTIAESCYCYKCIGKQKHIQILVNKEREPEPCISEYSHRNTKVCTGMSCFTKVTINYNTAAYNTETDIKDVKGHLFVKRDCMVSSSTHNLLVCNHDVQNSGIMRSVCSVFCSKNKCNQHTIYESIIGKYAYAFLPYCASCIAVNDIDYNSDCILGKNVKNVFCPGICYTSVYYTTEHALFYKRACLSKKYVLEELQLSNNISTIGHSKPNGFDMNKYMFCQAQVHKICNLLVNLPSFKILNINIQSDLELYSHMEGTPCYTCSARITPGSWDDLQPCATSSPNMEFQSSVCRGRCFTSLVKIDSEAQGLEYNITRGCDEALSNVVGYSIEILKVYLEIRQFTKTTKEEENILECSFADGTSEHCWFFCKDADKPCNSANFKNFLNATEIHSQLVIDYTRVVKRLATNYTGHDFTNFNNKDYTKISSLVKFAEDNAVDEELLEELKSIEKRITDMPNVEMVTGEGVPSKMQVYKADAEKVKEVKDQLAGSSDTKEDALPSITGVIEDEKIEQNDLSQLPLAEIGIGVGVLAGVMVLCMLVLKIRCKPNYAKHDRRSSMQKKNIKVPVAKESKDSNVPEVSAENSSTIRNDMPSEITDNEELQESSQVIS